MNESYQNAMEQITAPEALTQRTLQQMRSQFQRQREQQKKWWRLPVVAAICGMCMLGAVPVMAAHVPLVAAMLEQLSPELARMLTPVELSCTDNGIRMQVEAVAQSEEEILVYLTIQDLEGDRVDETTNLYHYNIDGYHTFTHSIISYDAEQRKALLELRAHHGDGIMPQKTVVQVTSFLSKEQAYENIPVAIQEGLEQAETMQVKSMDSGGDLLEKAAADENLWNIRVLQPGQKQALREDIDFVYITGMGYVDNVLHVQTWWAPSVNNHGYLSVHSADGQEVQPAIAYFYLSADGTPASPFSQAADKQQYIEYVWDISPEELAQCQLSATLFADTCYVEGNWKVSFTTDSMRSITLSQEALSDLPEGMEQVVISPLSVTLVGERAAVDGFQLEIDREQHTLRLIKAEGGDHHLWSDGGNWSVTKNRLEADIFIDIDSLQTVEIDGKLFTLPKKAEKSE